MVLVGTSLFSSDNSGAIKVKCIKILGSSYCNHSNVGDRLVIAVTSCKQNKKVIRKSIHRSILIRQKSRTLRKNGVRISFFENSCVLLKKNNDPLGSRVIGSVLQELRYKRCTKIMLLSWNII